jgi:hypothetical protein
MNMLSRYIKIGVMEERGLDAKAVECLLYCSCMGFVSGRPVHNTINLVLPAVLMDEIEVGRTRCI